MTLKEELQSRNFSIYGQWLGILSMVLCFALGIANIFHFEHPLVIIFSGVCLYVACMPPNTNDSASSFVILFVEVPLLLRICPTSEKFDTFIRRFTTNYMRAFIYLAMSVIQFCSLILYNGYVTSLIAAAIILLFTSACYTIAGLKGQGFVGSKTLGGQGVAQMIV